MTFSPGDPVLIRSIFRGGTRYTVTLSSEPSISSVGRLYDVPGSTVVWIVLDVAVVSEEEKEIVGGWPPGDARNVRLKTTTSTWCRIVAPNGVTGWYRYERSRTRKIRDPRPL